MMWKSLAITFLHRYVHNSLYENQYKFDWNGMGME